MTRIGPARLTFRGLRVVPGVSALLAVLVLVGAFLAVGAPRQTIEILTTSLHQDLAGSAGQLALNAELTNDSVSGPDAGQNGIAPVWSHLGSRLATIRHRLSALGDIVEPGEFAGSAAGFTGKGFSGSGTPTTLTGIGLMLTLEAAPSLHDDARLVAGRWPRRVVAGDPIEVVISATSAATLGWKIGQTQELSDEFGAEGMAVSLVGTVAPRDPAGAFWGLGYDRAQTRTVTNPVTGSITYFSTIWVDPDSWPTLAPTLAGRTISAWYGIDLDAVTADQATTIAAEVRQFSANPASLGVPGADQELTFRSGLPAALVGFTARSGTSTALIALFALGPAGALAAVLLLGLRLLQSRRSRAEALMRARGASGWQLRVLAAAEVAVWTVPAAVLGAVVAIALTPAGRSLAPGIVAVVLCALIAPVAAAVLTERADEHTEPSVVARSAGLVIEAAVVLVAALALVVLIARGPVTASSGVDPLVELAPLLLSIAVTVIVVRLMPFATRWLGAVQRGGRSAISLIAASSPSSVRRGGAWALFAVMIGVGLSVFSLTMVATQQHGVAQAALSQVGSDVAVSGDLTPQTVRQLDKLPGVAAHATIETIGQASLPHLDVVMYTVDPAELASVQSGIDASPLRVVHGAEAMVTNAGDPPANAQLDAAGQGELHFHRVDPVAVSFVLSAPRWILVDRSRLGDANVFPTPVGVLLRLHPGADPAAIAAAATKLAGPDATVRTAASAEAAIVGTPLDRAVHATILIATSLAAALCLIVFVLTLAAGATARLRRGAILRAMGFDRRQAALLVLTDVAPTAIVGVVVGSATGVGLAALVLHTIEPTELVGAPVPVALVVDVPTTAIALAGFVVAVLLAVAVAVIVDVARPPTAGLQTLGEER
ncbi:MAG TPA: FtsX-like permease family protein [Pseudolysinimonas sp.]|jgi:putative ABC transport system permease protein